MNTITTLGALKESGYKTQSIKEEIRNNFITKLKAKEPLFKGIIGYDDTVLPDIHRAILSRHNVLLLGLRGQAKTRIARHMVEFLDEYIPIVKGSEINDDPFNPLSRMARDLVQMHGDETEIEWVHRSQRYVEKLATPDVSVADLIGDIDPIKAANMKLSYADERVIHYGLIPRSHRSIFVINELPDLQARIQVSLFNILQEGDIQIRGFKMQLPLDIQFYFTANPEDYTNRGSIITPLKDRIESQILTHYPVSIEQSRDITEQEAQIHEDQAGVYVCDIHRDLIELIVFEARENEYIDEKSGVSTRLGISALENLVSAAERRMLLNDEHETYTRMVDFLGVIPSITGKVELVYEGEQEGSFNVALDILSKSIKELFKAYSDEVDYDNSPYAEVKKWFAEGNSVDILCDEHTKDYEETLNRVDKLDRLAEVVEEEDLRDRYAMMELVLHGLAENEVVSKMFLDRSIRFEDPFGNIFDEF